MQEQELEEGNVSPEPEEIDVSRFLEASREPPVDKEAS